MKAGKPEEVAKPMVGKYFALKSTSFTALAADPLVFDAVFIAIAVVLLPLMD